MRKREPKKVLSKKELLELLLAQEKKELAKMDDMVGLLIAKNVSINVNSEHDEEKTLGESLADKVAEFAGSWVFICCFVLVLIIWIIINGFVMTQPIDKFPFILLNLMLSCVAALQAPIIMMSQNRQEKKDRLRGDNDYKIDLKAEFILEDMYNKIIEILKTQESIKREIDELKKNVDK